MVVIPPSLDVIGLFALSAVGAGAGGTVGCCALFWIGMFPGKAEKPLTLMVMPLTVIIALSLLRLISGSSPSITSSIHPSAFAAFPVIQDSFAIMLRILSTPSLVFASYISAAAAFAACNLLSASMSAL